jgi:hypothetical protein
MDHPSILPRAMESAQQEPIGAPHNNFCDPRQCSAVAVKSAFGHLSDVTDCADDVRSSEVTLSAQYRFPPITEPNSRKDD